LLTFRLALRAERESFPICGTRVKSRHADRVNLAIKIPIACQGLADFFREFPRPGARLYRPAPFV
jgi:hypothetical protein